ncbi:hypothetical protein [Nocardioides coralli]|uniref:hypothetical protein n=1 Tax=Nocardioides coralli TaxID=2872154 RepID=UPI001CA4599E|nr:hypothetical protein [Nocardioides coralli]QZY29279.1 hypothetical protein K6T13_00725 [Nocardioides coralli]
MPATLQQLQSRLSDARNPAAWRWQARRTLGDVRDLLTAESQASDDGWLAARGAGMLRERDALLERLAALGPRVFREPGLEGVRADVRRLLVDVEHHLQRRRDLVWDEVELELGGSE